MDNKYILTLVCVIHVYTAKLWSTEMSLSKGEVRHSSSWWYEKFITQRMMPPTPSTSLVYSHPVDSDIHMNKGYVSRLLLKWNECSYVVSSRYPNLPSVIKTCSSFWYTAWGAMWFVLCAVIAIVTRTKMLVCSPSHSDQYLHRANTTTGINSKNNINKENNKKAKHTHNYTHSPVLLLYLQHVELLTIV